MLSCSHPFAGEDGSPFGDSRIWGWGYRSAAVSQNGSSCCGTEALARSGKHISSHAIPCRNRPLRGAAIAPRQAGTAHPPANPWHLRFLPSVAQAMKTWGQQQGVTSWGGDATEQDPGGQGIAESPGHGHLGQPGGLQCPGEQPESGKTHLSRAEAVSR